MRCAVAPATLALILLISCGYGLNAAGIFDRDEGLYSTAARQMLESGDWAVPRIGPDVRYAKPPMLYWLQAPCIWLLGPTPLAARLPSALAASLPQAGFVSHCTCLLTTVQPIVPSTI